MGRPKGALNKSTADVKRAAQQYTTKALQTLATIMETGESEPARISAAKELLDRGYGRAPQALALEDADGEKAGIRRVVIELSDAG